MGLSAQGRRTQAQEQGGRVCDSGSAAAGRARIRYIDCTGQYRYCVIFF